MGRSWRSQQWGGSGEAFHFHHYKKVLEGVEQRNGRVLLNCFSIEMKFTKLTLKVNSVLAFSTFTMLCDHPYLFQNITITPKGDPTPIISHSHSPLPPAFGSHQFALCFYGFAYAGHFVWMGHSTCSLLWPVYFMQHYVFHAQPCCSMGQCFTPFCDGVMFHCMDILTILFIEVEKLILKFIYNSEIPQIITFFLKNRTKLKDSHSLIFKTYYKFWKPQSTTVVLA